jgi:magnesium transporter
VLPARRLLLSEPETPVADIMVREVITIPQSATVLDACEFFVMHRLLAFPVVDDAGRVLGVVDVEVYTDEISELDEARRGNDLFQLVGVHLAESQQASAVAAFRSRFPWLLCNIGGGIAAAFLSGLFQAELERVVAIALFIPVVLALAESVSIQSVSLALQIMHGQEPTLRDLAIKLRRELATGAMLGWSCAALVAGVAILWLREWRVAACLFVGIATGVICAALFGVAIPNVLRLLRRDPRVAAGPVVLAASDLATLLAYFTLARLLV